MYHAGGHEPEKCPEIPAKMAQTGRKWAVRLPLYPPGIPIRHTEKTYSLSQKCIKRLNTGKEKRGFI